MPKYYNWNQGGGSGGGQDGGIFLKLQKGNKYRVRIIGKPLHYYQFWDPIVCRSPHIDENTKEVLCPLMQMNLKPKDRWSMWVFDRLDGNKLKVMDFPLTLYRAFAEWSQANNEEPGGANGPDWQIRVEAPSGKQTFTKYVATPLAKADFTEEEIKQMREGKLKERLMDLRKDNTPDEIREMLAKKAVGSAPAAPPEDSREEEEEHAPRQAPAAPAAAAASQAAPKKDDFEF